MNSTQENRPIINVDEIYEIFSQTVGSVKGASGLLLWSWVTYSHLSFDATAQAPITYLSVFWSLVVTFVRALIWLNGHQVNGWGPYRSDPKNDTILITGGSSGLGLALMAIFSSNGFSTVNLDMSPPAIDLSKSIYVKCDISDYKAVKKAVKQSPIIPSVLVNSAGTVTNSIGPFEELKKKDIINLIQTNYMGAIWITQTMSRLNPHLKMIVGISSSTALASPAFAGIYASSKAAVKSFYESSRHELHITRTNKPRVSCIVPGQSDTAMFANVKTPSQFWAPVVSTITIATKIYDAILSGRQGEMTTPTYASLLPYISLLPQSIVDSCRLIIGVDVAARPTRKQNVQHEELHINFTNDKHK